jgi:hypothetical protein
MCRAQGCPACVLKLQCNLGVLSLRLAVDRCREMTDARHAGLHVTRCCFSPTPGHDLLNPIVCYVPILILAAHALLMVPFLNSCCDSLPICDIIDVA